MSHHYKKPTSVHFKSLSPLVNMSSEILILNNAPSSESLKRKEYYAQPRNRFWELMCIILKQSADSYTEKAELLLKNKIALWSVFSEGDRVGKGNYDFENVKPNDFHSFLLEHPSIRRIIFNGGSALFHFKNHVNIKESIDMVVAKSTNPKKNRHRPFEELVSSWKNLL